MAGEAIATGAAANVLSSFFIEVVKEVKIVISLRQAVRDMEAQAEHLNRVIDDIKGELTQEQRNPKQIVKIWLDEADAAIKTSQSIRNKYQERKNCIVCCPNCFYRYRIGKDIGDWKQSVARLELEKQSNFPSSGEYGDYTPPTQIPIEIPESGYSGNAIRSAQSKLETWLTVDSSHIGIIGVYGMGGVGKTSLLHTINNSHKVSNSFDLVIWVTVSKEYKISDLQSCIADRLKLKTFPDESNLQGRKDMLCSYLKEKKFLLILDDMWKSLDLQSLGASLNERGSKIIITTRNKAVCTLMNAEEMIPVDPLLEDEGWQLFCTRAFRNGDVPADIEDVAREIAGECKGLPLAIIVVAAAMAHYGYRHEWELALHQMQTIDERFYDIHGEIEEKLFQRLKWSYNVLPNYLKTCFVYFAAYPEDRIISCEEVIEMWIAEGLEGLVTSGGQSYLHDTAYSFISFLRDRCLIEATKMDITGRIEQVKIHDVLRDLASLIAQKEHKCFFKAGQNVRDFPVEEDSKGWARVSLMGNPLRSLPTTFVCSSVLVLTLRQNPAIEVVPGSFLQGMSSLRVLDLSDTHIMSLPPSIGDLKHLASLQLYRTDIRELPESIGDLNKLQFLNVGFCGQLQCLPKRITELKCLRALDIWGCKKLTFLPRGISELVSLERLKMKTSIPLDFEEAPDANAERSYACLKDLQTLRSFRDFAVEIKSPVKEGVMGNWSKMRNLWLDFNLANQDNLPQDMKEMKDLERFGLCRCDVERLPSWFREFRKLAYLLLKCCKRLKELPAELLELPGLRGLSIEDCDTLKEIELGRRGCFPKMEKLTLQNLKSLECLHGATSSSSSSSGGLGEGALPLLKSFTVKKCEKLKTLPLGWDKLKSLEEIRGERDWWDAIQWQDVNLKTSLESKFRSS